jgi:hypothetical protein
MADIDGCFNLTSCGLAPVFLGRRRQKPGRDYEVDNTSDGAIEDNESELLVMNPVEKNDPEERLMEPQRQLAALCLGAVAAGLSLYALRTPAACVHFTDDEADAPKSCQASRNPTTKARLFDFCSLDCSTAHVWWLTFCLLVGIMLQGLTVLPTHCNCGRQFLKVNWRVSFAGDVAEFQEMANSSSGSWAWRRIQAWTGKKTGNLFEWLSKHLQKQSRMLPLPFSSIQAISSLLHIVAIIELGISIFSSLPFTSGHFECNGMSGDHVEVNVQPDYKEVEISLLVSAWVLLCLDLYLQLQATWMKCCTVTAGDARSCFKSTHHAPRKDGKIICPLTEHRVLAQAVGMELMIVKNAKSAAVSIRNPDDWGRDHEMITLCLKKYHIPPSTRESRRNKVIAFTFLAIIFLASAAQSCWTCVNGVRLTDTGTSFDVNSQLLLLGSCGRHSGSGEPCRLGCIFLGLLLVAQLVVHLAGDKESDNMAITLLDFRKYQENLLYDVYNEQDVRSHVWVQPYKDSWQIADFSEPPEARSTWRRSEGLIQKVTVVQEPTGSPWLDVQCDGLPDDEGPATIFIEFEVDNPCEKTPLKMRQIVPIDFLPGSFFCSVSVGKRRAWTLLSIAFCLIALALVGFDLGLHIDYYFAGSLLEDCNDILSGRCLVIESGDTMLAHTSIGFYLAAVGGSCILIDVLFLCCTLR